MRFSNRKITALTLAVPTAGVRGKDKCNCFTMGHNGMLWPCTSFNNGSQCVHSMMRRIFPCFYSNLPDVDANVGTRILYDLIVKFALRKLVVLNNQVRKKNIKHEMKVKSRCLFFLDLVNFTFSVIFILFEPHHIQ